MKILLIEDNRTISRQVGEFLAGHHWQVDFAENARLGVQLAITQIYDVILLDLNLPDGDGLAVCEEIKSQTDVVPPILMVTARDSFEDKAAGFHRGADDYLTKPFDLRELALRCKALARRDVLHQPRTLVIGALTLDMKSRTARCNDHPLQLTSIGFRILETLMRCYPEPASRSYISHQLWGDEPPESDALKSHIYALRRSLDAVDDAPLLHTIKGVGFRLELADALD